MEHCDISGNLLQSRKRLAFSLTDPFLNWEKKVCPKLTPPPPKKNKKSFIYLSPKTGKNEHWSTKPARTGQTQHWPVAATKCPSCIRGFRMEKQNWTHCLAFPSWIHLNRVSRGGIWTGLGIRQTCTARFLFWTQHHKYFSVGWEENCGFKSDVSGRNTSRLMCPACDCSHNNIKAASVFKTSKSPRGRTRCYRCPVK